MQCKALVVAVRVPRARVSPAAPVRSGATLFIASSVGVLPRSLVKRSVTIFFSTTGISAQTDCESGNAKAKRIYAMKY